LTQAVAKSTHLKRETALFLGCLMLGLLLLPIAIYAVGFVIFGEFGGGGFGAFFSNLHGELRGLDMAVWFLVLSPYLVIQSVRATAALFRRF
jgi:hypothetical protein